MHSQHERRLAALITERFNTFVLQNGKTLDSARFIKRKNFITFLNTYVFIPADKNQLICNYINNLHYTLITLFAYSQKSERASHTRENVYYASMTSYHRRIQ